MKKWVALSVLFLVLVLFMLSYRVVVKNPMDLYRLYLLTEIENSIQSLENLRSKKGNVPEMQKQYHQSRKHYKHVEVFVEYFSSKEAKFNINGPLVPKADPEYGNKVFYPKGFQAIEEILFSNDTIDENNLIKFVDDLIIDLDKLKIRYSTIHVKNEELLEMLQYELYRITALNLNGYDATISLTGLQETVWCFEGMQELMKCFKSYKKLNADTKIYFDRYLVQTKNIILHLETRSDYYDLPRLEFTKEYVMALNQTMVRFHNATKIPWTTNKKALNLNNEFLFGKESFNMRYFSIYYDDTLNLKLKAELGERLFFDESLSGGINRSCATCHQPDLGFTDGLKKSFAITNGKFVDRNAPTLLNVAFQQAFFHDGHVSMLEQQIIEVIHNPTEMNGDLNEIVLRLQKNNDYKILFKEAFKGSDDEKITAHSVIVCLSEYEKTLVSLNSRFDEFLRGDVQAMTGREINGYNLFAGKALCGSCHFFPLFNGTVPPFFNDTEFEILGTPANASNESLDLDEGRFKVTRMDIHRYSFKTPTVRNIELTGPYMHNGVYQTLDEVVEFYHKGGGIGFGYKVPNQTLPFDSLQLSTSEKEDIVLFLKTLTDTTSYR
jgi:cytochrome c peroxidase